MQTGRLDESPMRLRQRGMFLSFSQKCGSESHIFVKKNGLFCPAGGNIPRKTRDRLLHVSIGRFAVFAHFAAFVVQTLTA
ncbi:MAG: hypothetical protein ACLFVO_07980 [Chloroflexaceae bacterium]